MINIEQLKALADKATQGDYEYNPKTRVVKPDGRDNAKIATVSKWDDKQEHADGTYIAAANPETVLKLIAEIEMLRNELDQVDDRCGHAKQALASSRERVG